MKAKSKLSSTIPAFYKAVTACTHSQTGITYPPGSVIDLSHLTRGQIQDFIDKGVVAVLTDDELLAAMESPKELTSEPSPNVL